jgi:hypothetical protein
MIMCPASGAMSACMKPGHESRHYMHMNVYCNRILVVCYGCHSIKLVPALNQLDCTFKRLDQARPCTVTGCSKPEAE